MATSVLTRRAVPEDVAIVFKFICALEEESFNFEVFAPLYERNINDPDNIYLVAVDNELVVGYLSCHEQVLLHHVGKVFEIQELYVEKEYRGQGVGRLLIQSLEKIIGPENYKSLEVTSNAKRIRAHQFYEECGFARTHVKLTKSKQ